METGPSEPSQTASIRAVLWTGTLSTVALDAELELSRIQGTRNRIPQANVPRGLSSLVKKRKPDVKQSKSSEQNDDDIQQLLDSNIPLPSDAEVAFWTLRAQFPRSEYEELRFTAPVILRSQLYALLHEHIALDRDLAKLRQDGVIREYALLSDGRSSTAFVLIEDLRNLVTERTRTRFEEDLKKRQDQEVGPAKKARKSQQGKKIAFSAGIQEEISNLENEFHQDMSAIDEYLNQILPRCSALYISVSDMERIIAHSRQMPVVTKEIESLVNRLIKLQLLLRRDESSYWFSMPNMGLVLGWIRDGRRELLRAMKGARFGQVLFEKLSKRRLARSKLGTVFHIRDVVGRG
eukprot:CAMPEP_0184698230 /NCGR_PEP_ID=MMETSP0313-20130426/4927_1 /TAXON_ID=2792 /ORGANISM="Porphyridium aerugineum, Strain SAG 1380-2" /LENGTH=349 /DNA_ID=CAMNT_0027157145 /DNA_START=147 /DNA_END=1192 /DNA_ORIENTATION=-